MKVLDRAVAAVFHQHLQVWKSFVDNRLANVQRDVDDNGATDEKQKRSFETYKNTLMTLRDSTHNALIEVLSGLEEEESGQQTDSQHWINDVVDDFRLAVQSLMREQIWLLQGTNNNINAGIFAEALNTLETFSIEEFVNDIKTRHLPLTIKIWERLLHLLTSKQSPLAIKVREYISIKDLIDIIQTDIERDTKDFKQLTLDITPQNQEEQMLLYQQLQKYFVWPSVHTDFVMEAKNTPEVFAGEKQRCSDIVESINNIEDLYEEHFSHHAMFFLQSCDVNPSSNFQSYCSRSFWESFSDRFWGASSDLGDEEQAKVKTKQEALITLAYSGFRSWVKNNLETYLEGNAQQIQKLHSAVRDIFTAFGFFCEFILGPNDEEEKDPKELLAKMIVESRESAYTEIVGSAKSFSPLPITKKRYNSIATLDTIMNQLERL